MNDEAASDEPNKTELAPWVSTRATQLREEVELVKDSVMLLKKDLGEHETENGEDRPEQFANVMLAYRHLEDAKMRLGKVIQATVGGQSVYDK